MKQDQDKKFKQRVLGLDMLRSFAAFFVLSVHFFGNTKFSTSPLYGRNMFIQLNLRWFFYMAVPLFLLLTGYLQVNKTPTKKYYFGIVRRVILPYTAISILTILFRVIVRSVYKELHADRETGC